MAASVRAFKFYKRMAAQIRETFFAKEWIILGADNQRWGFYSRKKIQRTAYVNGNLKDCNDYDN